MYSYLYLYLHLRLSTYLHNYLSILLSIYRKAPEDLFETIIQNYHDVLLSDYFIPMMREHMLKIAEMNLSHPSNVNVKEHVKEEIKEKEEDMYEDKLIGLSKDTNFYFNLDPLGKWLYRRLSFSLSLSLSYI